jgi:uncharacterized protein
MAPGRHFQVVVKSSKFCNLRCRYCYEFAELGSRERMGRPDLRRMYTHVRDYVRTVDDRDGVDTAVTFIWHGGEPLMLEPGYYWDTLADLDDVFGDVRHRSVVQTNLTVLDEPRLALLRSGFDAIGVSVDLFGGLRVNIAGHDSQDSVLANLDRLREEGIPYGCVTVLTAANLSRVDDIFHHYEATGTRFRVLPLFDGAFADQHSGFDVGNDDIITALCRLFDLWLASPNPVEIFPLNEYVDRAIRHITDAEPVYYDRRSWLDTILVNTDGETYAFGDPYGQPDSSLGNLFTTPLTDMFTGPEFNRSALDAEHRIAANCLHCDLFGACTGSYVADGEVSQRDSVDGTMRACVVERAVITHIASRLRDLPDLRRTTRPVTDELAPF